MLLKSRRRMHGFKGQLRWTHHFLLVFWLLLLAPAPPTVLGYFLGDTKAVLNGCEDHWTLRDRVSMPQLHQMTVCVHIRVVDPGPWVAFSYSPAYASTPELGLEGDDEALYVWLLRVRHRIPLRLSPRDWHRVCLRRDVHSMSFSLEVDWKIVAEKAVAAQAMSPSRSLWLGCHRNHPPGAKLGVIELYLFRVWADLDDHGLCEDGTVVGWDSEYWGVTSPSAAQRDPNLMCDRRVGHKARVHRSITTLPEEVPLTTSTSNPVLTTPNMNNPISMITDATLPSVSSTLPSDISPANQISSTLIPSISTLSATLTPPGTSLASGSPLVNCDVSQLCSNDTAYFWMSISVTPLMGTINEQDVKDMVSKAFGCSGNSASNSFCQGGTQLQAVDVSCDINSAISETTCGVLLQFSRAVSPCDLQAAGASALQQSPQIQATITGAVERVGRNLCQNVEPSSGAFVSCTSTSSLDDICQFNKLSSLTCSLVELNSNPNPQSQSNSCSGEVPRFCDCTASCSSASTFFALRINIDGVSVDVNFLQGLLSSLRVVGTCTSQPLCGDYAQILSLYKTAYLECHGTQQRLSSCMVILEMSGPVNSCSLSKLMQQVFGSTTGVTIETPVTSMVLCGPSGVSLYTLLASNWTWVSSSLQSSDVCQPDPTLFTCGANEILAVLLNNNCPVDPSPTPQATTQLSSLTNGNLTTAAEATPSSVTNTTEQTYTTAQQTNTSEGTVQPNITTPLAAINSTQTSSAQPILQTSSQNTTDSTVSTAKPSTSSPNATIYNLTTDNPSSNTTNYNGTTSRPFTPSTSDTTRAGQLTPSENDTTLYNLTTVEPSTLTATPTSETEQNTTAHFEYTSESIPGTNTTINTTISTTFLSYTTMNNATTVFSNYTTTENITTTTVSVPNNTTNIPITDTQLNTTATDKNTTLPTISPNSTINATISTVTPSPNYTTVNNVTVVTNNDTTENITTIPITETQQNTTSSYGNTTLSTFITNTTISTVTQSPNYTTVKNAITVFNNYTTTENITTITVSPNNTTAIPINVTQPNTTAPYRNTTTIPINVTQPNTTAPYGNTTTIPITEPQMNTTAPYGNTTTIPSNVTQLNTTAAYGNTTLPTISPSSAINATISIVTPSSNYTTVNNVTVVTNNESTENITATTVSPNNITTIPITETQLNTTAPYGNTTTIPITEPQMNTTAPYENTTLPTISPNSTINATHGTVTPSPNYTTVNNISVVTNNDTTENITATTISRNNTTTIPSNVTQPNTTVPYGNNTTTMPSNVTQPNTTAPYGNTTTTMPSNVTQPNTTAPYGNTTLPTISPNSTINATFSTVTPSPNSTTVNNATTVFTNYTTTENNINITFTPISITPQNTTLLFENTTVSTNETLKIETNVTADNSTAAIDNSTTPTTASLYNQTTNRTTVSVTHNNLTNNNNDNNSTTTGNSTFPTVNQNVTAGISFNNTTNVTTTTPAANITATSPTMSSTTLGIFPTQINTSTASTTATLQTTTLNSTTTTVTGTGTTISAQEQEANNLLSQAQNASLLNSSAVAQLVGRMEKLLSTPTVSQAVGQKTIQIVSNLMSAAPGALSPSANRLIHLVDDLSVKLNVNGDTGILSSNSLVLAVRAVDGSNFPATSVDIFNTENVQLQANSRSRFKRSAPALGSVFLPSSLTSGLSPEQQEKASRVQFTFYTKPSLFQDASLTNQTIISPVLGSSVSNMSISNLTQNIIFTIQNTDYVNANYLASCVFWDFTLNGGGGGWSSVGCSVVNSTLEGTTCSCNHLTSFAILLDLSRGGTIDRQQGQILTFITYIGCGISAIFLAVTLLTYLSFDKLMRDIPAKILVQLCISLLFLNLVFLLDGWLALYPATGLCISTAFFLHYFLLTTFTWAGLEALHMYLSIVRVFTPYLSKYMLKFALVGWGIPLIVVIIIISVDKNNYGLVTYGKYTDGSSDDFCWLRNSIAFYVGVVAYFLLIFALCLVVFIVVLVQLSRIKKQNPQNQPPNRGVLTDLRSIAGLIVLLGLTWGFALFAWGPLYLPFVYLFTIFNSLQGLFIFVFHCAVKENVRRQWRTYLCCGKLRLAENSDWSRTATHNYRNPSVTTAMTSALQSTSRSASVISNATNGSGSVFLDSGISDTSNSDVVLNEQHRRNLTLQGET